MEPNAAVIEDASRLWDEQETARYLGVSVEFLQIDRSRSRREARAPRIAYVKLGRAVRYDPRDVIAFKDRCKIAGPA